MERIKKSVTELIGHTPLLEPVNYMTVKKIENARILAKMEYLNPAGSVKDRAAFSMILDAEEKGLLKPGGAIIEPTSGNTGIGLASVAAARGYRAIFVMPETMSKERVDMLKAYGAQVVLTPGAEGMSGAIRRANELAEEMEGSFLPGQFENGANAEAHYRTTGPEIWEDTDGKVDLFVAGVGTGGTITGIGRYLKEKNPDIRIVAVEPAGSPVLSGGQAGPHGLQGIGAGFVPKLLDTAVYDEVIPVKEADAFREGRLFARAEGILNGISSGAALYAASVLAGRAENAGKTIVVLLPDSGDRYLSTSLFTDEN
ncbi:MAG TPA: cysteine synthase A [Candidatus Eisenbergiella pullicola]|nr:cysteine synthase A [Candidatus Eisenbergiella pullicola]